MKPAAASVVKCVCAVTLLSSVCGCPADLPPGMAVLCGFELQVLGQTGGAMGPVEGRNGYLYAVQGTSLRTLDVRTPAHRLRYHRPAWPSPNRLTRFGGGSVVASGGVAVVRGEHYVRDLAVAGNAFYVAQDGVGLLALATPCHSGTDAGTDATGGRGIDLLRQRQPSLPNGQSWSVVPPWRHHAVG